MEPKLNIVTEGNAPSISCAQVPGHKLTGEVMLDGRIFWSLTTPKGQQRAFTRNMGGATLWAKGYFTGLVAAKANAK